MIEENELSKEKEVGNDQAIRKEANEITRNLAIAGNNQSSSSIPEHNKEMETTTTLPNLKPDQQNQEVFNKEDNNHSQGEKTQKQENEKLKLTTTNALVIGGFFFYHFCRFQRYRGIYRQKKFAGKNLAVSMLSKNLPADNLGAISVFPPSLPADP
ncbi:hypothetical protein PIB30_057167 [Stylosanthes scabra]|uniref:Uncharacterized protein n=1 Tax=Stylosanthes scabra TaxID=79078 RepID=A0ABU6YID3_9FABA|nr:hypothetical protein [Stylosanthes scabra]